MSKSIILTYLIIFVCFGCIKNDSDNDSELKIEEFKKSFKNCPFESFSSIYNKEYLPIITYPSGIVIEGYCGVVYKYSPKSRKFDSVIDKIQSKSISKNDLKDSLKFYVPSYKKKINKNKLPILNVFNPRIDMAKKIDNENTDVFIFNYDEGDFFSEMGKKEIKEWTNIKDDNFQGKGYSNGALVDYSNKYIIYWTIIW